MKRDIVIFLHDCGNETTQWYQLYTAGICIYDSCDVDVVFLEIVECRIMQPATWISLFHLAFPLLMGEIGAKSVSLVGYGRGADAMYGITYPCKIIAINPRTTPIKSDQRNNVYLITTKRDEDRNDDLDDLSRIHTISDQDIEHCKLTHSSKTRLEFSVSLRGLIMSILKS